MPNNAPYSAIDIPKVMSRNLAARDIVSGFASAIPTLSVAWHHLQAALTDTRDLAVEVARLSDELQPRASATRTHLPRCAPRSAHSATESPTRSTTSAMS